MPLSSLRRPLFLGLILYVGVLTALRERGFFAVRPARELRLRESVTVEGLVVSPLKEDHRGEKVFVRASRAGGVACREKILVYLPRGFAGNAAVRPGLSVSLKGELRLPRPARNPGEFDERAFLDERGAGLILKAESLAFAPAPAPLLWLPFYWAEAVRRSIEDGFKRLLPADEAHVLTGLTMGYKGPLSRDYNRAVQDAGVMHLLVPSGAKVAFILLFAAGLAGLLRLGPRGRWLFAALLGGFYTLMVGADPPYVRAYLGAMGLWAGYSFGRESGAFQATILSAWAILLLDPRALFSAGFRMTYAAMAGLLVMMPTLHEALPGRWPRWAKRLVETGAVTVVVQLMLWPIFAGTFGRGSLVGALANMLLVPCSGLLMGAGFSLWGLSWFMSGRLLACWARGVSGLLWAFRKACFFFAACPGAAVELSPMTTPGVLAYYLAVTALLVWPRRRVAALLLGAAILVNGGAALADWAGEARLRVIYLDQPGNPAVVYQVGHLPWLINKCPLKALKALGVKRLERVVLLSKTRRSSTFLARLREEIPYGMSESRTAENFELCSGSLCLGFSPVLLRKGKEEFDIIAPRLRKGAVEVRIDGNAFQITPFSA